jgi:hypothetical protein
MVAVDISCDKQQIEITCAFIAHRIFEVDVWIIMPLQWVVGCKMFWTKGFGIFNQEHKSLGFGTLCKYFMSII